MLLDPRWTIVVATAALTYGALSPIVSARRLYFFASSMPHAALLAAVLGFPLSKALGGDPGLWAVLIGVPLSYIVAILVDHGVSEDTATAVFVSFTVSASIAAIYYVLTRYPAETDLWAYILGDPLLVSWSDVLYTLAIGIAVLVLVVPFMREHVMIGLDRDSARLSGIRVRLYDYAAYTAVSLAAVGLIRSVGFVLEHVLILLPATIAIGISESGAETALNSVLVSLAAGLGGLLAAVALGTAPSAMIGALLLAAYLASLARGRW